MSGIRASAKSLVECASDSRYISLVKWPLVPVIVAFLAILLIPFGSVAQDSITASVTITAPADGSTHQTGDDITVEAFATDPAGIQRLEVWINNELSGVAAAPQGQTLPLQMELMLRWVPAEPGSYTLQARSINSQNLSPISLPVVLTVIPGVQPTVTPGGCTPMITVQARALNVRTGPGTTYGLLGRMTTGETAEVTGRNSASTWWRIRYGTASGWVSASYTTPSCTDYVPVVDQPTPAPTATPVVDIKFWADSTNINAGQCTTLRWEVDNVKAVYLNEGGADQGVTGHGNKSVCPGSTTTYRLIVIRNDDQRVERELTIHVQGGGVSIDFRADSTKIKQGECTTLRWDVDNAKAVYISDGSQEGGVSGHGSAQICPNETTTYVLRAVRWDNNEERREVKVKVEQGPGSISFWADSTDINKGECTTIHWKVTDAKKVYLNLGQGELQVDSSGSTRQCPPSTATYYLRVEWHDGQQSKDDLTITVHDSPPAPVVEFYANPPQIHMGESSTLTWSVQNAREIRLDGNPVDAEGTQQVAPEQDTTYTLLVIGLDNSQTEYQVTVQIIIAIITPTINITANPTDIVAGDCSTLSWSASHGYEFYINGEPVDQNGTKQVCPTQTTDYTLRVVTLGTMDAYQTVRVNVGPSPMPTVGPGEEPTATPAPVPTQEPQPQPTEPPPPQPTEPPPVPTEPPPPPTEPPPQPTEPPPPQPTEPPPPQPEPEPPAPPEPEPQPEPVEPTPTPTEELLGPGGLPPEDMMEIEG